VPLIMPKLGAPIEPTQSVGVDPWWRTVSSMAPVPLVPVGAPESLLPIDGTVD